MKKLGYIFKHPPSLVGLSQLLINKKLGFRKTPSPPSWDNVPNNGVFIFWWHPLFNSFLMTWNILYPSRETWDFELNSRSGRQTVEKTWGLLSRTSESFDSQTTVLPLMDRKSPGSSRWELFSLDLAYFLPLKKKSSWWLGPRQKNGQTLDSDQGDYQGKARWNILWRLKNSQEILPQEKSNAEVGSTAENDNLECRRVNVDFEDFD